MALVFIDGQFYRQEEAKVSVFDHGFLFGDGLFETIRAYDGYCFRLTEHIERLYEGAELLRIKLQYSMEEVADFVNKALSVNELTDA
ncbi:MAG: aminotransferase class IV, partial [Bacillota bacterium]|nr:aminotransferase class IV [Bacillota bacterium]